jgi:hypothetical protein
MRRVTPADVVDVLDEVAEFLDNYVDVVDGDYGEPRPNRAMSLQQRVQEVSTAVQQQIDRDNHDH